jgi:hypothetical protein
MMDLLVRAYLRDLEQLPGGDLPWIEDFGLTMHRQRLAHERETRMTGAPFRDWWLDQPGWVRETRIADRQAEPSMLDRFLGAIGDLVVSAVTQLSRRTKPIAETFWS